MRPIFSTLLTMLFALTPNHTNAQHKCICDTEATKKLIKDERFNWLPQFDTVRQPKNTFYSLSADDNKKLWYRDVESPDTTSFTSYWNDYATKNYHASHLDFCKEYTNKQDIELAFQFGPNIDLWAYHIFVVRKINCCYLITRSYFRHARFTYKAYAILDSNAVDSLFLVINSLNKREVTRVERDGYSGYFVNNRAKEQFFVNFDTDTTMINEPRTEITQHSQPTRQIPVPKKEVKALYDFVDHKIKWQKSYGL